MAHHLDISLYQDRRSKIPEEYQEDNMSFCSASTTSISTSIMSISPPSTPKESLHVVDFIVSHNNLVSKRPTVLNTLTQYIPLPFLRKHPKLKLEHLAFHIIHIPGLTKTPPPEFTWRCIACDEAATYVCQLTLSLSSHNETVKIGVPVCDRGGECVLGAVEKAEDFLKTRLHPHTKRGCATCKADVRAQGRRKNSYWRADTGYC